MIKNILRFDRYSALTASWIFIVNVPPIGSRATFMAPGEAILSPYRPTQIMFDISRLFRSQLEPSLGCTEPAAIALSTSVAYNAIHGILPSWLRGREGGGRKAAETRSLGVDKIYVELDRNTFKNSIAARIPRAGGLYGVRLAAALGVFCDPEKRLLLFRGINREKVEQANLLLKQGRVECKVIDTERTAPCIEINSRVEAGRHEGSARSLYKHCNIVYVARDNKALLRKEVQETDHLSIDQDMLVLSAMNLQQMVEIVENLSEEDKEYLLHCVEINRRTMRIGLQKTERELVTERTIDETAEGNPLTGGIVSAAGEITGAATRARMSGEEVVVVSCGGSGTQGLTSSLPILSVAERVDRGEERLVRSVALSFLVTLYATSRIGYLPPLCGCAVKAGLGAAAGVTYYLGGEIPVIRDAIGNIVAGMAGVICDGGKPSCSIKSTATAAMAVQSALLALKGVRVSPREGIVSDTLENTMENLQKLSVAMDSVDRTVVQILREYSLT